MNRIWKPVGDGFQHRTPSYPVQTLTLHNHTLTIADRSSKSMILPFDLALCISEEVPADVRFAVGMLGGIVTGNVLTDMDYEHLSVIRKWIRGLEE